MLTEALKQQSCFGRNFFIYLNLFVLARADYVFQSVTSDFAYVVKFAFSCCR
jgi:hypothetical protein